MRPQLLIADRQRKLAIEAVVTVIAETEAPHVEKPWHQKYRRILQLQLSRTRRGLRNWTAADPLGNVARGDVWRARAVVWCAAVAVGFAAVAFALLTEQAAAFFIATARAYPWAPFILTPGAGFVLTWLTRRYFAGSEGSGIPQVIAEIDVGGHAAWRPLVSLRIAAGKILVGVAAIGAGFSLGREGPTVQVGASLMAAVSRYLPAAMQVQRHHLLVAGGAAGIAAAFNTPLAGIVFAIEELSRRVEPRLSGVVITAIVFAGVIAQAWLGKGAYFGHVAISGETSRLVETILLCALVTGLAGGLFCRALILAATRWRGSFATYRQLHPYRFAATCGLLVAAIGWASGGITWCSGYEETKALLQGHATMPWYFGPAKFLATVLSYLSGLPGGIFAPSLAIGAGLGNDLAPFLAGTAESPTVMVLCMVGFLAAVTQAPLTSFIIVMEMVDGYALVSAMMAAAMLASGTSRLVSRPLYATLADALIARQRGKTLPALTTAAGLPAR